MLDLNNTTQMDMGENQPSVGQRTTQTMDKIWQNMKISTLLKNADKNYSGKFMLKGGKTAHRVTICAQVMNKIHDDKAFRCEVSDGSATLMCQQHNIANEDNHLLRAYNNRTGQPSSEEEQNNWVQITGGPFFEEGEHNCLTMMVQETKMLKNMKELLAWKALCAMEVLKIRFPNAAQGYKKDGQNDSATASGNTFNNS